MELCENISRIVNDINTGLIQSSQCWHQRFFQVSKKLPPGGLDLIVTGSRV